MSVIVRHKVSEKKYVMIGTGYGIMKSNEPKYFGHHLLHQDEEKLMKMAAVSDEEGNIFWYDTDELSVLEIDGVELKNLKI